MIVSRLSNKNFYRYSSLINPKRFVRSKDKYHLDHIYTVVDGWRNNIPPKIISCPYNLQMLSQHDNNIKHSKSEITLEELHINYKQFNRDVIKERV